MWRTLLTEQHMCKDLYTENGNITQMEFYWRSSSVSLVGVMNEVYIYITCCDGNGGHKMPNLHNMQMSIIM
jgi:hypothetical protein